MIESVSQPRRGAAVLIDAIRKFSDRFELRGRSIVVAVSGGIDSIAMLHAMVQLRGELGWEIAVAHVDHGLRGDESTADARFVQDMVEAYGVPVSTRCVDPTSLRVDTSSRERPTLQEAARIERYAALHAIARERGCDHIATAHNLDDQAETVLLRLLRGTGPDGLGGIPERSPDGVLIRPMLTVERLEIERYTECNGLKWREDSSNQKLDYARNRLRHRWIPQLSDDFNPRFLRAIGDLAEAHRTDAEWLDTLVSEHAATLFAREDGCLVADPQRWGALPEGLARRLALWALRQCGGNRDASRVHIERMLGFVRDGRSGSHIELPGGVRMARDRNGVRIGPLLERE